MDIYFLEKGYRKAGNAIGLFREMEWGLSVKGVRYVVATSRLDRAKDAGPLFRFLGWKPARTVWEKWLKED